MSSSPTLNVLQFICPTGFYGAERWIIALARHLDASQVQCHLAVTREPENPDLALVSAWRHLTPADAAVDAPVDALGNAPADTPQHAVEIPMRHRFDLSVIKKLVAIIHQRNIHIIHTHGYKSDILGVIAARRAGIRCVTTPHGFENAQDIKLRTFIWLGCKAMTFAHAVVPLSQQLMDDSRRAGVKEQRLHYIQNGVDLTEVDAQRQQPRQTGGKRRIGFIGQLISRKNVTDILDIFHTLHQERSDIELCLLGDGDARPGLEAHADTLPCRPDIHFLGFRQDRLALLQSFDLFVMTSTLEGIPRCLMEACAMGVPVAAYNIAGIDQLIRHDHSGLLAAPGDKATLTQHWRSLLDNADQAQRLAQQARQDVNAHYSAQRMADEYSSLFREVAA